MAAGAGTGIKYKKDKIVNASKGWVKDIDLCVNKGCIWYWDGVRNSL
jgi:hypothetical protein